MATSSRGVLAARVLCVLSLAAAVAACSEESGGGGNPQAGGFAGAAGQAPLAGQMATAGTTAGTAAAAAGAPVAGVAGAPMAGAAGAPMAGAAGEPMAGAAGAPMAGAAGEPMAGAAGEPMAGAAGEPMAGAAGEPMAGEPPPTLEEVNVAVEGPHAYDTFTEGAAAPEYAEGLVYYPTDSDGPFPVMILSPGLTANNTDYEVWGRVLASHGIVALLVQPTSTGDWNDARSTDLQAALGVVRGQLGSAGPLAGKLDTANVGFMGQSMGGGGTLIAANQVGGDIQAAIPMEPYAPNSRFPNITAPTLIIAAERDTVASVSSNAFAHYNSIPDTTIKIYMEGAGADHYYSTDRYEDDFEMNARFAVAFLKLYLEGDTRYEPYLYGAERDAVASQTSRYLTSQ